MAKLTHVDKHGRANMVDVSHKPPVRRVAVAQGDFVAAAATLDRLTTGKLAKGDALAVARVAGIVAAKRTDELIPLCHSLPLDHLTVNFQRVESGRLRAQATATTTARTDVEMEALVAVTAACLTLYDMTKAIDKGLAIEGIKLLSKQKKPPSPDQRIANKSK